MKQIKFLVSVIYLGIICTFLISCEKDKVAEPSKISFAKTEFKALESAGKITLGIQLDQPAKSDVAINLTVGGTATSGVDYTFPETTTTIKAGENTGSFSLTIILDCLAESDETIEVSMSSASGISASGTYLVTILANSAYVQKNFLGSYSANEPGYGDYDVTFTADANDPNSIIVNNFWDFSGIVKYTFDPLTNKVTIPTQDVVMGGTTYVVSAGTTQGTYVACTGTFTAPYVVKTKSGGAVQDVNTHTFTKK
jgi:hypothetical protein